MPTGGSGGWVPGCKSMDCRLGLQGKAGTKTGHSFCIWEWCECKCHADQAYRDGHWVYVRINIEQLIG